MNNSESTINTMTSDSIKSEFDAKFPTASNDEKMVAIMFAEYLIDKMCHGRSKYTLIATDKLVETFIWKNDLNKTEI